MQRSSVQILATAFVSPAIQSTFILFISLLYDRLEECMKNRRIDMREFNENYRQ